MYVSNNSSFSELWRKRNSLQNKRRSIYSAHSRQVFWKDSWAPSYIMGCWQDPLWGSYRKHWDCFMAVLIDNLLCACSSKPLRLRDRNKYFFLMLEHWNKENLGAKFLRAAANLERRSLCDGQLNISEDLFVAPHWSNQPSAYIL